MALVWSEIDLFRGNQPIRDAASVYFLRKGGAIIIGKTVTITFGGGDPAETRNPFDLRRTPGGSSSGTCAGVGSTMIPCGLGTHGRGSTIRPSSFCGVYGLKGTFGALNRQGTYSAAETMDHLGVIDLAICFHAGNNSFLLEDMYKDDAGFAKAKLPVVASFHQLLLKEIPAMFPTLRWGYVEVSAQWVPYALNDLSIRLSRKGKDMSPTIMADNRMWVACQVTDDLDWVLKYAGESQIVVGTDYGHNDTSTEIKALRKLSEDGQVSPEVASKILEDNSRALYGL